MKRSQQHQLPLEAEEDDEADLMARLALEVEMEVIGEVTMSMLQKENWKTERKELEEVIWSLREEKRDLRAMLKAAMLEKEQLQKQQQRTNTKYSFDGSGGSERGWWLHKFGFGFLTMADSSSSNRSPSFNSTTKFDEDSQAGEICISLASTFENITGNLRQEITHLRRSLDESRLRCHHLQILSFNQTQDIDATKLYKKHLKEREGFLTQKVEDLNLSVKEVEEEALRWREACEKEVEAAQIAMEEYKRQIANLQEELRRTSFELHTANTKIALKEKIASAAMAAQAAAEVSLQMADRRTVNLRQQIEMLLGQLEEEARRNNKGWGLQRARHFCWPWRAQE